MECVIMTKPSYRVIFEGDLFPGYKQSQVQAKLATLLKLDDAAASRFFSGKMLTMRSEVDLSQAKKYVCALARLGAIGYIVQEVAGSSKSAEIGQLKEDGLVVTDSFDIAAVKAYFDDLDEKQEEIQKESNHEIFGLDSFDEEVANMQKNDDADLTGKHDVLNAEQIKKLLKKR